MKTRTMDVVLRNNEGRLFTGEGVYLVASLFTILKMLQSDLLKKHI
jgi:hypothetical protein